MSFTAESASSPTSWIEMSKQGTAKPATRWQKVHRSLGFQQGYNFPLFIIFAGAMVGLILARLSYLNIGGSAFSSYKSGSSPGEWYWNSTGFHRAGITIHLGVILPGGFLLVWQFVPVIRHKLLLFHRINGYLVILLVFVSNVGALMIARRAFAGSLETQAAIGILVILTASSRPTTTSNACKSTNTAPGCSARPSISEPS